MAQATHEAEATTDIYGAASRLWETADELRANSHLKAAEYAIPVLGLIFLKFADSRFARMEAELAGKTTGRRQIGKADYQARGVLFLPERARFSMLLQLKEGDSLVKAINDAMALIEEENPSLRGVLPRTYQSLTNATLVSLLRSVNAILGDIAGDAFGKVYEYFLGKFAIAEGAKGGEYFTPTSIVRLIVEIIEPFRGKILDPACGSGGMFVQSARFVEEHRRGGNQRLSIYGQERVEETVKLCKMNLAVHGLEGQVSQSAEPLPHVSRRRGVLRTRRVGWKPHRSSRGYSAISASPDPELRRPLHRSCRCWRDLQHSSGGPNEASQFASDRG